MNFKTVCTCIFITVTFLPLIVSFSCQNKALRSGIYEGIYYYGNMNYETENTAYYCSNVNTSINEDFLQEIDVPTEDYDMLETISFTNSNIPMLFPSISTFKNVKTLELKENNIKSIISGFFASFPELTELHLEGNNLTKLSDGLFSSLKSLTNFYLSRNQLTELSEHSFAGIKNLRLLDLSQNRLTSVPWAINFLNSYCNIYLDNNLISKFDISVIEANSLSISNNKLNIIENVTFQVTYLDLSFNNIKEIGPNVFKSSENIDELDLQHNNLTFFPPSTFKNISSLKSLDISYNSFGKTHQIPSENWLNLYYLKKLNSVSLSHNFWECSTLKEIVQILHSKGVKIEWGDEYGKTDILGIACSEKSKLGSGNFTKESFDLEVLDEVIGKVEQNFSAVSQYIKTELSKIESILKNQSDIDTRYLELEKKITEISKNFHNITANVLGLQNTLKTNNFTKDLAFGFNSTNYFDNKLRNYLNFSSKYVNLSDFQKISSRIMELENMLKNKDNHLEKIYNEKSLTDTNLKSDNENDIYKRMNEISIKLDFIVNQINASQFSKINKVSPVPGKSTFVSHDTAEKFVLSKNNKESSSYYSTNITDVLNTIMLFVIAGIFIYFLYINIRKRHNVSMREEVNLV